MHSLNYYIDAALRVQGIESDRQLSLQLDLNPGNVCHWRNKRTMPGDETMVHLAKLGNKDQFKALLDLNIWRSEGDAKNTYKIMAEYLKDQEQDRHAA